MDGATIAIVVLVIVIIVAVLIYYAYADFPLVNCADYGLKYPLGDPKGPQCDPGDYYYGGFCYKDTFSKYGGKTTDVICGIQFPGDGSTYLNCEGTINTIEIGQSCSELPDWDRGSGWIKTSACTCQKGGYIDLFYFCQAAENRTPTHCPDASTEYFLSGCYGKCPTDYTRSAVCSCSKK